MRKITFILTLMTLAYCTPKQGETATETPTADLVEVGTEQVAQIVAPKQNDTIYITNFFATWCGPCMHEIPYFKEKMDELKDEKVKFTFISVDAPKDWGTAVNDFAIKYGLEKNIVLFNNRSLSADFFSKNFQYWDGSNIPFTLITKGSYTDETIGMLRKEDLAQKIEALRK